MRDSDVFWRLQNVQNSWRVRRRDELWNQWTEEQDTYREKDGLPQSHAVLMFSRQPTSRETPPRASSTGWDDAGLFPMGMASSADHRTFPPLPDFRSLHLNPPQITSPDYTQLSRHYCCQLVYIVCRIFNQDHRHCFLALCGEDDVPLLSVEILNNTNV